ncbi:MAG: DUF4437 domain-containing protein [Alphaproteobacteria bacterium]|nr:DUF4437 domain-containing protein [Alphaproteobacteria bacterium]
MPRPHIEYIQAQALPWQKGLYAGDRPGALSRTLSVDDVSGAASVLIKYPPGWRWDGVDHVAADEEFLVLSGAIAIGARDYRRYDYGLLPAGYPRGAMSSATGAIVVAFFSAPPLMRTSRANAYDERKLVLHVATTASDYGSRWNSYDADAVRGAKPALNINGISKKLLRHDPDTGDQTWALGAVAGWPGGVIEIHPVVEEMYLVSGEIISPMGNMQTGAYFWRPPHLRHGPFGTGKPTIHLFRTEGGPLSTVFERPATPMEWRVPYSPILPPHLAHLANTPWPGPWTHE